MAVLEEAFDLVSSRFQISSLNDHQKEAIRSIVVNNKDVLVNLPTGFGKSLIYQALPLVFDHVSLIMIGLFDRPKKQRERNVVRFSAAVRGKERCVTRQRTAA